MQSCAACMDLLTWRELFTQRGSHPRQRPKTLQMQNRRELDNSYDIFREEETKLLELLKRFRKKLQKYRIQNSSISVLSQFHVI